MKTKKHFLILILIIFSLHLRAQINLIDKNWTLNSSLSDEFNTYNGIFPKWGKYYVLYEPSPKNNLIQNTNRTDNLYIENNDIVVIQILHDYYQNGSFEPRPFSTADFETNLASYLYGYFEAKIKLPKGDGYHPAFWLWNGDNTNCFYNEIDILEPFDNMLASCTTYGTNVWVFNNNVPPIQSNCNNAYSLANRLEQDINDLPDLSADWHIYGCEWLPDRVEWYFDNKIVRVLLNNSTLIPVHPMKVNIGNGIDYPISDSDLSNNKMKIEYFHYYQLNEINCTQAVEISNFDFNNTSNFSLKKSYTLTNSSVPSGLNSTLRATDYVILGNNFFIPANTEFNIKINPCY